MDLGTYIRTVPDFPHKGIEFKDITTLLQDAEAFQYVVSEFHDRYHDAQLNAIVAMDARGFIFGSALAYSLGLPLVLVRKAGKLPHTTISQDYVLEYAAARLEMHVDALQPGDRVVLVDDLLATGGTMEAAASLVEKLGAEVVELAFVIELPLLNGRKKLSDYPIYRLVEFMVE